MKICEQHFCTEDLAKKLCGRKDLKDKDVIPTLFKWSDTSVKKIRKPPSERSEFVNKVKGQLFVQTAAPLVSNDVENLHETCHECSKLQEELKSLKSEFSLLAKEKALIEQENATLKLDIEKLSKQQFNSENIKQKVDVFKSFTSIPPSQFDIICEFLNPGKNAENIKYYKTAQNEADQETKCKFKEGSKPGSGPKLDVIEQLFMYLVWMRCGLGQKHLAWFFNISKSTVSRYLITWSNYLYFALGSIPIWPSRDQINLSMPDCFKDTYPTRRCIIDCTEIFAQVPSNLQTQSALYSSYKHHVTYKALIGICPAGSSIFISQLYPRSISDKEIVERCGILHSELWENNDSVMADRGFTIADLLTPLGVKLNIPAFLDGRDQLERDEVVTSQKIAAVRIHVERAIARIKKFKVLKNDIPLNLNGSINQVWTNACLLCNFMGPLIKK